MPHPAPVPARFAQIAALALLAAGAPVGPALDAAAQGAAAAEDDVPVAGIGRQRCQTVIGPENAPILAQAADWALGYMAGRIDAGQVPVEGESLSPDNQIDIVTGLVTRCRGMPEAPVIDAVRDYADRIFDSEAEGGAVEAEPLPPVPDRPEPRIVRPEPRPTPPETATADVDTDADLDDDPDIAPEPRPDRAPRSDGDAGSAADAQAPGVSTEASG